jgi:hypothetical protein
MTTPPTTAAPTTTAPAGTVVLAPPLAALAPTDGGPPQLPNHFRIMAGLPPLPPGAAYENEEDDPELQWRCSEPGCTNYGTPYRAPCMDTGMDRCPNCCYRLNCACLAYSSDDEGGEGDGSGDGAGDGGDDDDTV